MHIYQDEITTAAEYNGASWIMRENIFRASLKYLDNTRDWELKLLITPFGPANITVQDTIHNITTSRELTFTLDASLPVNIEIEAPAGSRITPTLTATSEGERFALMAYLPNPDYSNAIIGTAIIGSFNLPNPRRKIGTILGKAILGTTILGGNAPLNTWQNILGPTTRVEFSRGIDHNGLTGRADPGSLTFTAYNAFPPAASTLIRGVEIVLIDAVNRRPLFTGKISASRMTPTKDGTYISTFTALDAISDLAKITKYQDTRPAPQPWYVVISSLISGYPAHISTSSQAPLIGNLVTESSLVNYLDIFTNTAAASWYTAKDGTLIFTDTPPGEAKIIITDEPVENSEMLPVVSPIDIEADFDTSEIFSRIDATNNNAAKNPDGEWESTTETVSVENLENLKSFGEKTLTIETAAANTVALRENLEKIISKANFGQIMKYAHFHLINNRRPRPELDHILALEILDPVQIIFRHTTCQAQISRISASLTPRNFTANLEFILAKGK